MRKKIHSVEDLAGILRQQFLNGFYDKQLPLEVLDPHGTLICTIKAEDSEKWVRTPYEYSFASTQKLCSRQQWEEMTTPQQVELCDCWYALAVCEYLEPALDEGKEFDLA